MGLAAGQRATKRKTKKQQEVLMHREWMLQTYTPATKVEVVYESGLRVTSGFPRFNTHALVSAFFHADLNDLKLSDLNSASVLCCAELQQYFLFTTRRVMCIIKVIGVAGVSDFG